MWYTALHLEFERPEIGEIRTQDAAGSLQPAVEVALDGLAVNGALVVIGQQVLRADHVATVAAQVVQTAAGLAENSQMSDLEAGTRAGGVSSG